MIIIIREMFAATQNCAKNNACGYSRQSAPGMIRFRNLSNMGTVKAVSPWLGLHTMPFMLNGFLQGKGVAQGVLGGGL
jgi:hypothetical protein